MSGIGGDIGQSVVNILSCYFSDAEIFGSDIHNEFFPSDIYKGIELLPPVTSSAYIERLSEYPVSYTHLTLPTSDLV